MNKFTKQVKEKADRAVRARKNGNNLLVEGFKTMGIIGWSVALCTILGIALGLWLGHVLIFLFAGIIAGCILAWRLSIREITIKDKKNGRPK
jgi:ATP synthase protein I